MSIIGLGALRYKCTTTLYNSYLVKNIKVKRTQTTADLTVHLPFKIKLDTVLLLSTTC